MPSLRVIRTRIRSVNSTQKITKAMKMVAAARLRRSQQAVEQSRPYAKKVEELLDSLASALPENAHPLFSVRPIQKRLFVVMSSDRGLCGSFNAVLFRRAEKELADKPNAIVLPIGKKGTNFFSKKKCEQWKREGFWNGFKFEKSEALVNDIVKGFLNNEFDQVDLLYNEFVSVITQKPVLKTLLPISVERKEETLPKEYIFEPTRDGLVKELIPKIVSVRFYGACLNSQASEYGARMTAMDSATRNAGEMINKLTLNMNRARQAAITKELMEIISGAEALK